MSKDLLSELVKQGKRCPMKKNALNILILTVVFLLNCSMASAEPKILDISSGKTISFSEMILTLQEANYIFLGDDVTAKKHSVAQMEIIEAIYGINKKLVVGVESFRSGNQYILDQWSAQEIKKRRFVDKFNENWGDWNRYNKLFKYIRDNNIKLAALNIPREILIQVEIGGLDSLSISQAGTLGEGIICYISQENVMRRRHLYKGIFKNQNFKYYCEMQILGDIMMSKNLMKYHEQCPDHIVIILAGDTHSWKHGIPSRMSTEREMKSKIVLFEAERATRNNVTIADADYLWLN